MRVMSREQSELLEKLVRLADGDALLVEDAIWASAKGRETAKLSDIVEYISQRIRDSRLAEESGEAQLPRP